MHELGWDITSEYNLIVNSQSLDFVVFKDSVWKDSSLCDFSSGISFTINFLVTGDDNLTVLALSKYFLRRKYILRSDGFIAGLDANGESFSVSKDNIALYLNGKFVRPSCYTATANSIRLHTKGERKFPGSTEYKDYVSWKEGDVVYFLTNDIEQSPERFKAYSLSSTTLENTSVRSANGINFTAPESPSIAKGKVIVMVNGEIIPYKEMTFPGGELNTTDSDVSGALVINRKLRTTDKVDILYFDEGFEHFEYKPKSGQTHFEGQDLYGNFLTYSAEEGSGVAQLFEYNVDNLGEVITVGVPWSSIVGVRKGCKIHASALVGGITYNGEAIIQESIMDRTSVSVQILSPFGRSEFDSSEWYVEPPESKDIVSYLDERTQETTTYPEILRVFQHFFLDQIQDGLDRLSKIRNVDSVEPSLLASTLDMLGMRLDLSSMPDESKRRAVKEVVNFYKRSGTKNSINFLGYINNKVFALDEALWTNDYIKFYTPFELGATYERKKLYDFTDYRFVSAVPTSFDDYGKYLDGKVPVKLDVEGSKLYISKGNHVFFPKHWRGVGYSMNWVYVERDLSIDAERYAGGIWYLVLKDNNGSQSLEFIDTIPSGSDTPENYYYDETTNAIIDRDNPLSSVSLPIAIVYIDDEKDYKITVRNDLSAVTFVNDYIYCSVGSNFSFSYFDSEDKLSYKKVTRPVSQRSSIKPLIGKHLITFGTDSSDPDSLDTAVISTIPDGLYTGTGNKPVLANSCLMYKSDGWYVFDNITLDGLVTKLEDGTFKKDDVGMIDVRYFHEGCWTPCEEVMEADELPSLEESLRLAAQTKKRLLYKVNELYYTFVRRQTYDIVAENIDEAGVPHYEYGYTYERASNWTLVTRIFTDYYVLDGLVQYRCKVLNNLDYQCMDFRYYSDSEFYYLPFVEGEVYYNKLERKHYKFTKGAWKPVSFVVIGEFDRELDVKGRVKDNTQTYSVKSLGSKKYVLENSFGLRKDTLEVTVNGKPYILEEDTLSKYDYSYPRKVDINVKINENKYLITFYGINSYECELLRDTDLGIWYVRFLGFDLLYPVEFYKDTKNKDNYIQFLNESIFENIVFLGQMSDGNWYLQFRNSISEEEPEYKAYIPHRIDINLVTSIAYQYSITFYDSANMSYRCEVLKDVDTKMWYIRFIDMGLIYPVDFYVDESTRNYYIQFLTDTAFGDTNFYGQNDDGDWHLSSISDRVQEGQENVPQRVDIEIVNNAETYQTLSFIDNNNISYNCEVLRDTDTNKWYVRFVDLNLVYYAAYHKDDLTGNNYLQFISGSSLGSKEFYAQSSEGDWYMNSIEEGVPQRVDINLTPYEMLNYVVTFYEDENKSYVCDLLRDSQTNQWYLSFKNKGTTYPVVFYKDTDSRSYFVKFIEENEFEDDTIYPNIKLFEEDKVGTSGSGIRVKFPNDNNYLYATITQSGGSVSKKIVTFDKTGNEYEGFVALVPDSDLKFFYFSNGEPSEFQETKEIIANYSCYKDVLFDVFYPYQKINDSENKFTFTVGLDKSFRFDSFVNVSDINIDSIAIIIDGERWGIEKTSLENIEPLEKKVLIRRPSAHSMYALFGNNEVYGHGMCPKAGTVVEMYYVSNSSEYVKNRWFINSPTFEDDTVIKVASDYGLITQDNLQDWVWFRTFDPPEGFYPTNHVQFNVNSNGITNSEETDASTRYQFYELSSTPLVLDKLCNVIEFEDTYSSIGSMSFSSVSQLLKDMTPFSRLELESPVPGAEIVISNDNSFDSIYVIDRNKYSGSVNKVNSIVSEYTKTINNSEVECTLYNKVGDPSYKLSYDEKQYFAKVPPRAKYNVQPGDVLYMPTGNKLTANVNAEGYESVILDLTANQEMSKLTFKGMKKKYTFKVNVVSENTYASDEIKVYISGIENKNKTIDVMLGVEDETQVTVSVRQHGCHDFDTTLNLKASMFNSSGVYTYTVNLTAIDVNLYLYAPETTGKVVANGVQQNSGYCYTYKYGTNVTCYAICDGYKAASGTQIVTLSMFEDRSVLLTLEKLFYRLTVTTTVGGVADTNQPVYLNSLSNTNAAIWAKGESVVITAGGYNGDTNVVRRTVVVKDDNNQNKYVIDCPLA